MKEDNAIPHSGQNPHELLPVVDDQDRQIGALPRWQVHRDGLKHRAVHILVSRSDGKVYLQQRALTKDSAPGKWDSSSSGHVDSGESYPDAAIREIDEELGIKPESAPVQIGIIPASPSTGNEFTGVFKCSTELEPKPNPNEIQDGKWLTPADIDDWISKEPSAFARCFLEVWRYARKA